MTLIRDYITYYNRDLGLQLFRRLLKVRHIIIESQNTWDIEDQKYVPNIDLVIYGEKDYKIYNITLYSDRE